MILTAKKYVDPTSIFDNILDDDGKFIIINNDSKKIYFIKKKFLYELLT